MVQIEASLRCKVIEYTSLQRTTVDLLEFVWTSCSNSTNRESHHWSRLLTDVIWWMQRWVFQRLLVALLYCNDVGCISCDGGIVSLPTNQTGHTQTSTDEYGNNKETDQKQNKRTKKIAVLTTVSFTTTVTTITFKFRWRHCENLLIIRNTHFKTIWMQLNVCVACINLCCYHGLLQHTTLVS